MKGEARQDADDHGIFQHLNGDGHRIDAGAVIFAVVCKDEDGQNIVEGEAEGGDDHHVLRRRGTEEGIQNGKAHVDEIGAVGAVDEGGKLFAVFNKEAGEKPGAEKDDADPREDVDHIGQVQGVDVRRAHVVKEFEGQGDVEDEPGGLFHEGVV